MNNQPTLQIKPDRFDILLKSASLCVVGFAWTYSLLRYSSLPIQIATHFDFEGKPNDFGSKNTIWILPGISTFIVVFFHIIGKRPDRFNYITMIDASNAAFQYKSALRMLNILSLNISILLTYILYEVIKGGMSKHAELDMWFIPVLLLSVLTPTFYFIYSTSKKKKKTD